MSKPEKSNTTFVTLPIRSYLIGSPTTILKVQPVLHSNDIIRLSSTHPNRMVTRPTFSWKMPRVEAEW